MVAEARPRQNRLKNCLKAASSRDSWLEDYISVYTTTDIIKT